MTVQWRYRRRPALIALTALTLAVGVLLGIGLAAPPAWAHGELVASQPAAGQHLTVAPAQVRLTFDEAVRQIGTRVEVRAPGGALVSAGAPRLNGPDVYQNLTGTLPSGRYRVAWRVTAADGHPVAGEFGFDADDANVVAVSGQTPAAAGTAAPAARAGAARHASSAPWLLLGVPVILLGAAVLIRVRRGRPGPAG